MPRSRLTLLTMLIGIAAIFAAALGHGVVDALTNRGFIAGPYATYRHDEITSALIVVLAFAAAVLVAAFYDALARVKPSARDWLEDAAASFTKLPLAAIALAVFGLQLCALVTIEAIEQTARFGHPLGFLAALGAPVLLALIIHGATALLVAGSLRASMRAIVVARRVVANAAKVLLRPLAQAPPQPAAAVLRARFITARVAHAPPLARKIANRPPPISIAA